MDPLALVLMAAESITAHKLRSFLVTLGILIGVAAVLINASLVEGFQAYFEEQMQALGSNFVTVRPASSFGLLGPMLEDESLDPYVYDSVRRLPYADYATASRTAFGEISYMGQNQDVVIVGVEPGYLSARNRTMISGDSLVAQDRFNAIIGDSVVSGAATRPIALMTSFDLVITVDGEEIAERFRVKGIVEETQPIGRGVIYVPIRTLNDMMATEGYTEISLFAADVGNIDQVKRETMAMLDRLMHVEPERNPELTQDEEAGVLGMPLPLAEGERKEYRITTQSDVLEISEDITGMIQLALVAIAGISLLVGGIGIANVMLVTVAERTREIGVMKAVGAKNRQVMVAFLFEAALIGLIGVVPGLSLAAATAFTTIPILFDVPGSLPIQWAGIATGISLGISLLSGLYPALRAARMDPVQALRSE